MPAYSVSVTLRSSIALGSQPGASSAKSIRRIWEATVFHRQSNDLHWLSLSRRRRSEEGSSKVSGVALMAREVDADGMGDSAIGMTLFCASCQGLQEHAKEWCC